MATEQQPPPHCRRHHRYRRRCLPISPSSSTPPPSTPPLHQLPSLLHLLRRSPPAWATFAASRKARPVTGAPMPHGFAPRGSRRTEGRWRTSREPRDFAATPMSAAPVGLGPSVNRERLEVPGPSARSPFSAISRRGELAPLLGVRHRREGAREREGTYGGPPPGGSNPGGGGPVGGGE